MRRAWLLLVCCACAARPHALRVDEARLSLPSREAGELSFVLVLPEALGRAESLTWELSLDGARLASGVEPAPDAGARWEVRAPLRFRNLGWREGERELMLWLRGQVLLADGRRVRFRELRRVAVPGQPLLNAPVD